MGHFALLKTLDRFLTFFFSNCNNSNVEMSILKFVKASYNKKNLNK